MAPARKYGNLETAFANLVGYPAAIVTAITVDCTIHRFIGILIELAGQVWNYNPLDVKHTILVSQLAGLKFEKICVNIAVDVILARSCDLQYDILSGTMA